MAIVVFEHSDHTGADRLGNTLRDYGHRLRVIRLDRGDAVPADLDDVDGILTCGGPQSAQDDSLSWLAPQMDYLRAAHETERPIVGLCLGCQILARALGGTVETMKPGPEIGWHNVELNAVGREDILHTGIGWSTRMFHWHFDHVSELPPGARVLASSAQCRNQAWSSGVRTYGFQHHPEVHPATILEWAEDEPDALKQAGVTLDELRSQTERHFADFERLTQRLFESIALFLMPVERRYRGIVKDLHH